MLKPILAIAYGNCFQSQSDCLFQFFLREKIRKSYPFHPELIDVFRVRWASNHDFQRTRGVLRLLAAIISDLWKRKESLTGGNLLIDAGDVNFASTLFRDN
jgi:predicted AAA+ superfamily ATPase